MNEDDFTNTNFELEQDIMKCWHVVDDIRDIAADLQSGHIDQVSAIKALQAFADVYNNRFDRTFRKYETVCGGLHKLRRTVKDFGLAQIADPKSEFWNPKFGKKGKPKKPKSIDR